MTPAPAAASRLPSLPHPGPPGSPRIQAETSRATWLLEPLRPGRRLSAELTRLTEQTGAASAGVELLSGRLGPVHHCIPAPGRGGLCASFSEELIAPQALLLSGSATVGTRDGDPFVHAHLEWLDDDGRRWAGHSWSETRVGDPAPWVSVCALPDVAWISSQDPETLLPTFSPRSRKARSMRDAASEADVIVARLRPNQDLTGALVAVCRAAGHRRAVLRAGLGSLIGGRLINPITERITEVDGPATEVISLSGFVSPGRSPEAQISGTLVDRHGHVHSGLLIPGQNAVAVTFEVTLQPISSSRDPLTGAVQHPHIDTEIP